MRVEEIRYKEKVLAIIVKKGTKTDAARFFTPEDYPLQLGINTYKEGVKVKPHVHKAFLRQINTSLEVLHIEQGEAEVYFYNNEGRKVETRTLKKGDTIVLIGGHGLKFLRDTKIIEVKQGPYVGVEKEKKFLECEGV